MAFQAIASGLGRTGNAWSDATDRNLERALGIIQSKLTLTELQNRIQEQQRKTTTPQPFGTIHGPGGSALGVTFDQQTGKYNTQTLTPTPGPGQYPEFKSPTEATIWAIQHNDPGLLKKIEEHQRAIQKPTVEHPTEYSDWKKQNPQGTVEQWLATKKRFTKGTGEGGGAGSQDEIDAYAEDLRTGQITAAQVPIKLRGTVLAKLKREGAKLPKQLSADEKKGVDTIVQAMPLLDNSLAMLKGMEKDNSITSALRARGYWAMYNNGISPPEPFASYFQMAALLRVLLLAPYLHGIRNPEFVKQIQQHMPNPEKDTPKFMYDKAQKLKPVMERMLRDLKGDTGGAAGGGTGNDVIVVNPEDLQ